MRYLVTGDLSPAGWAAARRRILEATGRSVRAVDFHEHLYAWGAKAGGLQFKLGWGPGIRSYNRALLRAAAEHRPEIVWVDHGRLVQAGTLRSIKESTGAVLVSFNTDYLGSNANPWRLHVEALREFDVYFTSNVYDVDLLRERGIKHVEVVPLGYYGAAFGPVEITEDDERRLGAKVGFIGHWEPATEDLILQLLDRGLPVRVRGSSWHHARQQRRLAGVVERGIVPQPDYVRSVVATKINLGINSTANRNQTSGRSFEIPAAGGFLLAQRTGEHQALYAEGKEAEFYGSVDELVEKARYYLEHEEERRQIAESGRRRVLSSGTSFEEMMPRLAETVEAAARRTA